MARNSLSIRFMTCERWSTTSTMMNWSWWSSRQRTASKVLNSYHYSGRIGHKYSFVSTERRMITEQKTRSLRASWMSHLQIIMVIWYRLFFFLSYLARFAREDRPMVVIWAVLELSKRHSIYEEQVTWFSPEQRLQLISRGVPDEEALSWRNRISSLSVRQKYPVAHPFVFVYLFVSLLPWKENHPWLG